MIERIIVLGGGSAGFLAALSLKLKLPQVRVSIIRSKEIGIIGVGEGSTVYLPNFLHGYLGLDPGEFHRAVRPTYKLGIRFAWGPRPYFNYTFSNHFNMQYKALTKTNGYYCDNDCEYASMNSALMTEAKAFQWSPQGPVVRNDVAYHMENAELVQYLEAKAHAARIDLIDDNVSGVEQNEQGITGLHCASGRHEPADFFVDCSGFYSYLLGKTLNEPFVSFKTSLFCDRAVVGGGARATEPVKPYTTAETMNSGWCWQIEHDDRINRGYVYSSAFISDDEAEREFRQKCPKIDGTRLVKFVTGAYERGWVKNVVAIGNSSGFVEPLESTSLGVIAEESRNLAESLADCQLQPGLSMAAVYNKRNGQTWDDIRRFLAIHYRYNTRLDTPFWRACVADADIGSAADAVAYYQENGPSVLWRDNLIGGRDVFGFEGYLAMLVGQKVPYRNTYPIPERERRQWNEIQQANKAEAMKGFTVRQACDLIRSPNWKYRGNFYCIASDRG